MNAARTENYGWSSSEIAHSSAQVAVYVPHRADCPLVTEDDRIPAGFRRHNERRSKLSFTGDPDRADIVVLCERFSFKGPDYARTLEESPLVRRCADRLNTLNYDDTALGFLPGCYTSLRAGNFWPDFHKACAYPKTYNEYALDAQPGTGEPSLLFSFRGTIRSSPLRQRLFAALSGHQAGSMVRVDREFHSHTPTQKREYVREILDSRFVLCPRGW